MYLVALFILAALLLIAMKFDLFGWEEEAEHERVWRVQAESDRRLIEMETNVAERRARKNNI